MYRQETLREKRDEIHETLLDVWAKRQMQLLQILNNKVRYNMYSKK